MILEWMIGLTTVVLISLMFIELTISKPISKPIPTVECHPVHGESWKKVLRDMNRLAKPPTHQPVYTRMRNVPKDSVTSTERKYCKDSIHSLSDGRLTLIDIDNLDWMSEADDKPVVVMLDGRVIIRGTTEVIRVIVMWCESALWSIHPANAKGCFTPSSVKGCKVEFGSISNRVIQMPKYYFLTSVMGRKQSFEWDKDGILITEPASETKPMINSAWTERPPELQQNPTIPSKNLMETEPLFLKTFGVPRS